MAELACLVHLRELTLDSNKITDLKPIMAIESLVELSVRGNRLGKVDFAAANWRFMEKLSLSNNDIMEIAGLSKLEKLHTLDLGSSSLLID